MAGLDPAWVGASCLILGLVGGAVVRSWSLSGYLANLKSAAAAAKSDAAEAKTNAAEANTRITALGAEFAMYRERVAMDNVSRKDMREDMRDLKDDLVKRIDALGDKLDQVLSSN